MAIFHEANLKIKEFMFYIFRGHLYFIYNLLNCVLFWLIRKDSESFGKETIMFEFKIFQQNKNKIYFKKILLSSIFVLMLYFEKFGILYFNVKTLQYYSFRKIYFLNFICILISLTSILLENAHYKIFYQSLGIIYSDICVTLDFILFLGLIINNLLNLKKSHIIQFKNFFTKSVLIFKNINYLYKRELMTDSETYIKFYLIIFIIIAQSINLTRWSLLFAIEKFSDEIIIKYICWTFHVYIYLFYTYSVVLSVIVNFFCLIYCNKIIKLIKLFKNKNIKLIKSNKLTKNNIQTSNYLLDLLEIIYKLPLSFNKQFKYILLIALHFNFTKIFLYFYIHLSLHLTTYNLINAFFGSWLHNCVIIFTYELITQMKTNIINDLSKDLLYCHKKLNKYSSKKVSKVYFDYSLQIKNLFKIYSFAYLNTNIIR